MTDNKGKYPNFEQRFFTMLAHFIVRRKTAVVICATLLVILSMAASMQIKFITQVKDLMPTNNPVIESFNRINERFEDSGSILITVEGPGRDAMIQAAEDLVDLIRNDTEMALLTRAIQASPDLGFMREWLLLMQDNKDIDTVLALFDSLDLLSYVRALNDNFEATYIENSENNESGGLETPSDEHAMVDFMGQVEEFIHTLRTALEDPDLSRVESEEIFQLGQRLSDILIFGSGYVFDRDNSMLLFSIQTQFTVDDSGTVRLFMSSLGEKIVQIQSQYPGTTIGYAGELASTYDESAAIGFDLMVPSIIAVILIVLLFLFSFRRIRYITFTLVSLLAGIILDMGLIAITIGELNMITSTFGVLLIGLGVDFGVHIVTNFSTCRERGMGLEEALTTVFTTTGSAVFYGAVTTALAFLTLMFSSSKGISQFGFVAALGIMTTLVSMFTLLPSLLIMFSKEKQSKHGLPMLEYRFLGRMGQWSIQHRVLVYSISAILFLLLGFNARNNCVEYSSDSIGPQHSTSALTQGKLMERFGMSTRSSMVSLASLEDTASISALLKADKGIARVYSISEILKSVADQYRNLEAISLYRETWNPARNPAAWNTQRFEQFLEELQRLEWNMIEIGDMSVTSLGEGNLVQLKRNRMIREILGGEEGKPGSDIFQNLIGWMEQEREQILPRLDLLDPAFSESLYTTANLALSTTRPLELGDIPDSYKAGLVSTDSQFFRININPVAGMDQEDSYSSFIQRMNQISPEITGTMQIFMEFTNEVVSEISRSSILVAIVIILILFTSFRSLKYTIIAMGCLGLAGLMMFGLFPLFGITINAINSMVFPLIIGLGIDFFIHIIHRYRLEGDIKLALLHSGKPVVLSGLTTMIGFGSLGLAASHAGAASLGRVLFIGIGCAILVSFTLLPALLGSLPPARH
jgi:hypothetical protein